MFYTIVCQTSIQVVQCVYDICNGSDLFYRFYNACCWYFFYCTLTILSLKSTFSNNIFIFLLLFLLFACMHSISIYHTSTIISVLNNNQNCCANKSSCKIILSINKNIVYNVNQCKLCKLKSVILTNQR